MGKEGSDGDGRGELQDAEARQESERAAVDTTAERRETATSQAQKKEEAEERVSVRVYEWMRVVCERMRELENKLESALKRIEVGEKEISEVMKNNRQCWLKTEEQRVELEKLNEEGCKSRNRIEELEFRLEKVGDSREKNGEVDRYLDENKNEKWENRGE